MKNAISYKEQTINMYSKQLFMLEQSVHIYSFVLANINAQSKDYINAEKEVEGIREEFQSHIRIVGEFGEPQYIHKPYLEEYSEEQKQVLASILKRLRPNDTENNPIPQQA